ncbi:MAG: WD40 repeat domain-containing protein [Verrucomicrobiaceae bacterium]
MNPESVIPAARFQLLIVLTLACLAGIAAAAGARKKLGAAKHTSPGAGGRIGIRAGVMAALIAGAALTFLAVLAVNVAPAAVREREKMHMWITLFASLATLLPAVLSGFVGGLIGVSATSSATATMPGEAGKRIPLLRWLTLALVVMSIAGLTSPFWFQKEQRITDLTSAPAVPPPFLYEPPKGITSAQIGQIQPEVTKMIDNIRHDSPVSLSEDGSLLAYGDTSSGSPNIGVYDLHRFQKIASMQVPAYPEESLAWSPDQKSIACTIGSGGDRRIWILRVADGKGISLPRPPGRDTPGGELVWWQEKELGFFPTDEPPLVFDLEKLLLKPLDDSSFFAKLDADAKRKWLEGPRTHLPSQQGWKLDVRTVIRSAMPPPRRSPDTPWELFGDSICAMSHPTLPVSFGFDSLVVNEGSKVLCSNDGSKLIRLGNGRAEVVFMKFATAPELHFETVMPLADDAIKEEAWKRHVADGKLCVLVCAPLINPLNHQVVGPDYQQVRGIAQLVEWKGRNAIFVLQTYSRPIQSTDIATTLHAWDEGHKTIWNDTAVNDWWKTIKPVSRELPKELADLYMPTLLAFNSDASPFVVVKATERTPPVRKSQTSALQASPLSQSPFSTLGSFSGSGSTSAFLSQGTPPVPAPSPPAPITPPPLTEADVKKFVTAHHEKASQGDVLGMMADYDQNVDFLDKGKISSSAILAEETAHRQKWPTGSEKILSTVLVSNNGDLWTATYTIEFYNENASGDWHRGQADLTITMTSNFGRLIILSQRAKVHDLVDSKAMGKSSTANPPSQNNVTISAPKPCYVSTTKARDVAGLEFTDQISFVNGITWHRTYRELSPAGKVLRTCRAIYEGSGGLSQDRRSARIYVGSQEWDQTIKGGTLTGVCQRSAESMVGKAFNFQFTQGGMVESALGISFRLQK